MPGRRKLIESTAKAFGIGSLAGVLGSWAGMGGGFVMVPLMTSSRIGLKVTQHVAHGTSLFAVASTGMAGALGYAQASDQSKKYPLPSDNEVHYDAVEDQGMVDLYAAAAIALTGMITARFGASMTNRLSEKTLKKALGLFMVCIAPVVPAKKYISETYGGVKNKEEQVIHEKRIKDRMLTPAIIGLGSGYLAGLFGIGGGAIVVPALTIATDMNHYQALATSLCAMTLPATVGCLTHFRNGNLSLKIGLPLAFGSFIGAYLGGSFAGRIPEDKLRWGFSSLMLTLGVRTITKA